MNKLKKIVVIFVAFTLITIIINLFRVDSDSTSTSNGNDNPPNAATIEISDNTIIF